MCCTSGESVVGDVLQLVWTVDVTLTGQALVHHVGDGLSEGAEERWAVGPAHGQSEWEGNQWGFAWAIRHDDTKEGYGGGGQRYPVETVRQITF